MESLPFFLVILFCLAAVGPTSADGNLDVALPHKPGGMPPAFAPLPHHHHRRPDPHHHHLLAPGPSPLHAPAHAPAGHHHHHHIAHAPAPDPSHAHAHAPAKAPAHAPTGHHHHHIAPAPAPSRAHAHAPAKAPANAPVHPPAHAPTGPHVPRSFIAVQGVVYCKSCKYAGVDTLLGATPLLGAEVKLMCNSSMRPVVATTKTDKNGYFFLTAPKTVTTYAFHKCKVSLGSSPPSSMCKKPSTLHGGLMGATLRPEKPFMANKLPYVLYSVGPLAFEPQCSH